MITITIRGVTAAMIFDMESWEAIEETLGICYPEGLTELLRKPKDRLKTIRTIADLMSLEGERLGKGHHMPEDWLKENITPRQLQALDKAITAATDEGFKLETKPEDGEGGGTVDLAMLEIEKKEKPDA